jgi:hypothetical protein
MLAMRVALFVLLAAVVVFQMACGTGAFDPLSGLDSKISGSLITNSDARQVQDKMADALRRLNTWKEDQANKTSQANKTGELQPDPAAGAGAASIMPSADSNSNGPDVNNNSINESAYGSFNNSSSNSSNNNSSLNDSSLDNSVSNPPATSSGSITAGQQGVASDSKASFNGYYGITASRHEMGKSDIKSSMQLNGAFEVDKSVKFQDRGF